MKSVIIFLISWLVFALADAAVSVLCGWLFSIVVGYCMWKLAIGIFGVLLLTRYGYITTAELQSSQKK